MKICPQTPRATLSSWSCLQKNEAAELEVTAAKPGSHHRQLRSLKRNKEENSAVCIIFPAEAPDKQPSDLVQVQWTAGDTIK